MKNIINLYKPLGLTPLQAVEMFKAENPEHVECKIGYAGRLDPMAEGILLLLVDDENKNMTKHMKHDKTYEAEIVLNIRTDSYDLLGIPKPSKEIELEKDLSQIKKQKIQELPPYSAYLINGKPLFWYARNNKLPTKLPTTNIKIKKLKLDEEKTINNKQLLKNIIEKINLVKGDFRQKQIINKWTKLLKSKQNYKIIKLTISCTSGTYIRSIANQLNGTLYSLKRTKLGRYSVKNSLKL